VRVEVNGVRLFFDVEGAKLVPDGAVMREKPTLIDLRGCGRSDPGPASARIVSQWADDLRAFCDILEIERPIVLGQSGGGFVAIKYGARHRGHACKLILASTQARVVPGRIVDVVRRRSTPEAAAAADRWLREPDDPSAFRGWSAHGVPLYNHAPQGLWYRHSPDHLESFERCGHGVWRDQPARVLNVIREFIQS
jgi:pimeloyl-ACP methyl ester carboxylesterase